MARQSKLDRKQRLDEGRCPVHGHWMSQVDSWYEDEFGEYTIVGCPTKNCGVRAKARSINGPWTLVSEVAYLLQQGSDGSAVVIELPNAD